MLGPHSLQNKLFTILPGKKLFENKHKTSPRPVLIQVRQFVY